MIAYALGGEPKAYLYKFPEEEKGVILWHSAAEGCFPV